MSAAGLVVVVVGVSGEGGGVLQVDKALWKEFRLVCLCKEFVCESTDSSSFVQNLGLSLGNRIHSWQ